LTKFLKLPIKKWNLYFYCRRYFKDLTLRSRRSGYVILNTIPLSA
jgi:hypothetical protein